MPSEWGTKTRGSHRPAHMAADSGQADTRAPRPVVVLGPASHTVRDLGVLAVVVVVLAVLINVGSRAEFNVPVSVGNTTITNADDVLADAEAQFQQTVDAQATRVAEDAGCYFLRPAGPTQGALGAQALPPELGVPEDVEGVDLLQCGPVELVPEANAVPGTDGPPWLTGLVYYFPTDSETALRGEFQSLTPNAFEPLEGLGGLTAEHLIGRDGRHPDADAITEPTWREVTPSGDPPPTTLPGGGLPPDVSVPEVPSDPALPPGGELPPDVSVPELPPGVTVPPDVSVPELPPGAPVPEIPGG